MWSGKREAARLTSALSHLGGFYLDSSVDQRGDNRLDDRHYRNDDSTLRHDLWFTLNSQRGRAATPIPSHAAGMG